MKNVNVDLLDKQYGSIVPFSRNASSESTVAVTPFQTIHSKLKALASTTRSINKTHRHRWHGSQLARSALIVKTSWAGHVFHYVCFWFKHEKSGLPQANLHKMVIHCLCVNIPFGSCLSVWLFQREGDLPWSYRACLGLPRFAISLHLYGKTHCFSFLKLIWRRN